MSSYGTHPLGDDEYSDGEVYPLDQTSELGRALLEEPWLNMTSAQREKWVGMILNGQCRFVGTVWSNIRLQVELTLIFTDSSLYGGSVTFCVTLSNPHRFA